MVSASHNPADDNGLKVLDGRGPEARRRARGRAGDAHPARRRAGQPAPTTGSAASSTHAASSSATSSIGSAWRGARRLRPARPRRLRQRLGQRRGAARSSPPAGASVTVHFDAPDGTNINLDCGATAPARAGGDRADERRRRRASASTATPIAAWPSTSAARSSTATSCSASSPSTGSARGALAEQTVVVSILSNGGLVRGHRGAPADASCGRPVGDSYILDAMLVSGAGLGGEKSGHVIVREHATQRRRHRHGARGPGHPGAPRPAALGARGRHRARTPRSSAPCASATRNGAPTASWSRPWRPPRPSSPTTAASSCAPPARSRPCASWSRAATPRSSSCASPTTWPRLAGERLG